MQETVLDKKNLEMCPHIYQGNIKGSVDAYFVKPTSFSQLECTPNYLKEIFLTL